MDDEKSKNCAALDQKYTFGVIRPWWILMLCSEGAYDDANRVPKPKIA